MPRMMDDNKTESFALGGVGNFHYSGVRPDVLTSSEYTLATILIDTTGSVTSFADQLLQTAKTAVKACAKSPRADNLLVRLCEFNSTVGVREIHGYTLLSEIDPEKYDPFRCRSNTNLADAAYASVKATLHYAKILTDQDFSVNGAIYIVTDGEDNASVVTAKQTAELVSQAYKSETMEGLIIVLIGVNDKACQPALEQFKTELGLTQYVPVGEATPGKLAKLANFISRSISSASQALVSKSQPPSLTF